VPKLAIIRRIHLLPGREDEGVRWLNATEPTRRAAGQITQLVMRGQIDPHEYQWVQVWRDHEAYDGWRRSDERGRLATERGRYMTHEPSRLYDVLE
jgi:heme-degrading monooxygenase HmoA